ncbi:DUF3300 domain-containing protein [Rariglobus hedericola]|uniref:DUF3300 domain-containing protein n=1 Tax=Rariglobus hedericola TaxID=2597822 RepID=UPI001396AEBD|nr:DUF3300 domain-containing protein [Rariglobus hedericola]
MSTLRAQALDFPTPVNVAPTNSSAASVATNALRSDSDLDTMLGSIALYPDALIALILPASTNPANLVLAARHVAANGTQATLAAQPWDESIKALTHYPDVLRWMDQNLSWTQALGQAFVAQPADVMNAVQRLRSQARASGTLVDTPQQRVLLENGSLVIVPTQPEIIYVPVYDPAVVYVPVSSRVTISYIHFQSGYPSGPWLNHGFDWRQRRLRPVSYPYYGHIYGYNYPVAHRPQGRTQVWETGSPNSPAYRLNPVQINRPPTVYPKAQQPGQPKVDLRPREFPRPINQPVAPAASQIPRRMDTPQRSQLQQRIITPPASSVPVGPVDTHSGTQNLQRNRPRTTP